MDFTAHGYRNTAIGGEIPFMIYDAKLGKVTVLCGLGAAPLSEEVKFTAGLTQNSQVDPVSPRSLTETPYKSLKS
jgi:hypothetical protein